MTSKEKIKYYIIKDLDTGLYYRGKGQNRWGKYYNQASIFRNLAQTNNSVELLKRYDKSNAVAIEIEITEIAQKLSLSDCIKEWEDDGFKFEKIFCYSLINKKKDVEIFFDNESTGIWSHIKGGLTSRQLIRLIKTFKALGWEVEDETKRNDNRPY